MRHTNEALAAAALDLKICKKQYMALLRSFGGGDICTMYAFADWMEARERYAEVARS